MMNNYNKAVSVNVDDEATVSVPENNQLKSSTNLGIVEDNTVNVETSSEDCMSYIRKCQRQLEMTSYLKGRHIDAAVANKYMIGFDPNFTKNTGGEVWAALIIPTSKYSYVARNTDPNATNKQRYRKVNGSLLFNKTKALKDDRPIIVVEGELDALAIISVGGNALGLGSTSNYQKLIDLLKENEPKYPVVIALDNDKQGVETSKRISEALKEFNIPYFAVNLYGRYKDAGEAIVQDRATFNKMIKFVNDNKDNLSTSIEKWNYDEKLCASAHLKRFLQTISESVDASAIQTGYAKLDEILDGGLYEGLYVIGAISSLGKTTFALQMADNIAIGGNDVIIISLEMSGNELMSKSISRCTFLDVIKNKGNLENAKTCRGISVGKRYAHYSREEREIVDRSINAYSKYTDNIFIYEGVGDISAAQIKEIVQRHIMFKGKKPVVLVDYAQILSPYNERATDKQNIDKNILELKRISRDFKIPVFVISSFNRANYSSPVGMESFKESGAIEYSSDVLLGMQLRNVREKDYDVYSELKKNPREIQIVVLKNRNGKVGEKIDMLYYPMFNYIKEA